MNQAEMIAKRDEHISNGLRGAWLALSLTLTSYMGVEILAITAGEALQPEKTIPRAMRTVTRDVGATGESSERIKCFERTN